MSMSLAATARRDTFAVDFRVLGVFLFLMGLGVVLYYASGASAFDTFWALMGRKFVHVAVAVAAFAVASVVPHTVYERYRGTLLLISLGLLVLPLVPGLGHVKFGARRWVDLGPASFQPAELVKVTFVLYLAGFVTRKRDDLRKFVSGLIPSLSVAGMLFVLLLLEGDLGTAVILTAMVAILLFLGNARMAHLVTILLLTAMAGWGYVQSSPKRMNRLVCAADPDQCSEEAKWQTQNAQWAFGSGAGTGVGLGKGLQTNQGFLLKAQSDFVYAVVGEQMGYVGSLLVLLVYLILFLVAVSIAGASPDAYGRFAALGLGTMITLHALIHMGVTMRVPYLPTKGLCLPLVSAGGSSLIAQAYAMGALMSISRAGRGVWREAAERGSATGLWKRLKNEEA